MKISYGQQLDITDLKGITISLFLFANNHEKRALTCYKDLNQKANIVKSIGLCFNSTFLSKNSQDEITYTEIQSHEKIKELLNKELSLLNEAEINIAIDYSCMTKPWYYTIIIYLQQKKLSFKSINCYFIYTPSKFSEPLEPKPNTEIGPLPGKYIVPTDKPKALLVGLGYEKNKAEGIIDHLDPKIFYLLYSKPALDNKFVQKIEENNIDLLKTNKDKVVVFPLEDLVALEKELTSLYFLLREEYNIVIAPLGPKPFALISMILSVRYKDIDIWRVGSGSDINEYNREPIGDGQFIISKIKFSNESN